jgi:hypothetical protein
MDVQISIMDILKIFGADQIGQSDKERRDGESESIQSERFCDGIAPQTGKGALRPNDCNECKRG